MIARSTFGVNSGDLLQILVKALTPFEMATTFFSYEENAASSCILPVIFGLVESLKDCSDGSTQICEFSKVLDMELKKSSNLVIAAALDPRFKQLKFLVDSELQLVISELTERMETIQQSSCEVEAVEPQAKK